MISGPTLAARPAAPVALMKLRREIPPLPEIDEFGLSVVLSLEFLSEGVSGGLFEFLMSGMAASSVL